MQITINIVATDDGYVIETRVNGELANSSEPFDTMEAAKRAAEDLLEMLNSARSN